MNSASGSCICGASPGKPNPDCERCQLVAEVERLRGENAELIQQLREQTKSLCTHCGKLFPKGRKGLAEFRRHIVACDFHPLHPMAAKIERLRAIVDAQKALIGEYETITDRSTYEDDDYEDDDDFADLAKAERAVKAAEKAREA